MSCSSDSIIGWSWNSFELFVKRPGQCQRFLFLSNDSFGIYNSPWNSFELFGGLGNCIDRVFSWIARLCCQSNKGKGPLCVAHSPSNTFSSKVQQDLEKKKYLFY
jgi:hypothetical protein